MAYGSVATDTSVNPSSMTSRYTTNNLSVGAHYLQMLEMANAGGTSTFYGNWTTLGYTAAGNTCFMVGSTYQ
jgi:hypothetical protein